MMRRISRNGFVLVAALSAPLAIAQTQYKSTMPDGRVIYGDKPAPGAVRSEALKMAPSKGISITSPKDGKALSDLQKSRAGRDKSAARLKAAEEALRRAEAAQAAGKEPGPGDRIGTASGAQRFTDSYWQRQKQLEADVQAARANLERVRQQEAASASASASASGGSSSAHPGSGSGTPTGRTGTQEITVTPGAAPRQYQKE